METRNRMPNTAIVDFAYSDTFANARKEQAHVIADLLREARDDFKQWLNDWRQTHGKAALGN